MPIPGVTQPETIEVSNDIRLRKYDGNYDFAFSWYQDTELVYLVDGDRSPYDMDRLSRMYSYLDAHGEGRSSTSSSPSTGLPIPASTAK